MMIKSLLKLLTALGLCFLLQFTLAFAHEESPHNCYDHSTRYPDWGDEETFDADGDWHDIRCDDMSNTNENCNPIALWEHVSGSDCWGGSGGCAKNVFQGCTDPDDLIPPAEDVDADYPDGTNECWRNSSLGNIRFDTDPPQNHIYIRFLVKFGSDYETHNTYEMEVKNVIVNRCGNSECTSTGSSNQRFISQEFPNNANGYSDRAPRACDNTDCNDGGGAPYYESGKTEFKIGDHLEEWICYEYELDLPDSTYRVFIDTQDGEQDSAGGSAPYHIYEGVSNTNYGWRILSAVMGFWGPAHASSDNWVMIDNLKIDTSYIGPPEGFGKSRRVMVTN